MANHLKQVSDNERSPFQVTPTNDVVVMADGGAQITIGSLISRKVRIGHHEPVTQWYGRCLGMALDTPWPSRHAAAADVFDVYFDSPGAA